ncbi:MAG: hypothetical protein ACYCT7_01440, partial [bacterium]
MNNQNISIEIIAKQTYEASRFIANSSSAIKLSLLNDIEKLLIDKKEFLKSENLKDIKNAGINSLKKPLIDRLTINGSTMDSMIESIEDVKKIKDPIGEIENISIRPNGLMVGKMRIPLGVIGIIYESRP